MPDAAVIYVEDLEPGMSVPGTVHRCPVCQRLYLGRANRTYCSPACKSRAWEDARREQGG